MLHNVMLEESLESKVIMFGAGREQFVRRRWVGVFEVLDNGRRI